MSFLCKYRWLRRLTLVGLAGCALLGAGCATRPLDRALAPIERALDDAGMGPEQLGLVAFPLAEPEAGWYLNADKSMQPGSTMKLVTTIVALERLGAKARARTDLLATVPAVGEVLAGPLYLRGGADTDLDWAALWDLLRQLREQGVRQIQGGLVVDRTLFLPARPDLDAPPFDESPEFQYNVVPDALNLNGNMLRFSLQSDSQELRVRTSPALTGLQIDTRAMALVDAPCADWEDSWQQPQVQATAAGPVIVLGGKFPRHCRQQLDLNLLDRQWVTAAVVRQIWQQLGGQMEGGDTEGATPTGATVLATHWGRPLGEVVYSMMKRSDNPVSRLVYLRLGAQAAAPDEPSLDAAARVVRHWFDAKGIATQGLVLDNGSGLSRSERMTPRQMAEVLRIAHTAAPGPELLASLPLAGVDGTLARRFKGTAVEARARLKTGSLRNVASLAGYVLDARDRPWVVVALVNHDNAATGARLVLDRVIESVAGQP